MTQETEKAAERVEHGDTEPRRTGFRAIATAPARRVARLCRTARKRTVVVLALLAVVLVTGAGYLFVQLRGYENTAAAETAALDSARESVPTLLSYDHKTVDKQLAKAVGNTTGDFREQFAALSQRVIAPAAKQQQIVTTAKVTAAAVVGGDADRLTVLLFLNQNTKSKDQKEPKIDGSRLRAVLEPVDGRWLLADMKPV